MVIFIDADKQCYVEGGVAFKMFEPALYSNLQARKNIGGAPEEERSREEGTIQL